MNDQSRNRSVVAAHSLSSDARLRWDLSLRLQFWRCRRLKPKPLLRPRRPRRRPQMRRSLARSADRNGEPGERNGVRNDVRDAQSGVRSGAQDATSDETPATAPPPPSKKSSRSNYGNAGRRMVLHSAPPAPGYRTPASPRANAIALDVTRPGLGRSRSGVDRAELCLPRNLLRQRIATQM